MSRGTQVAFFIAASGLALLLICLIPVTSVDEVINVSFTVSPGAKYGPNDAGTSYHTRILGRSVLKGEVIVEGEGIYFTANFYNTEHLKDIYVKGQYDFVIDPADDLYVFIFNNNKTGESLVKFTLKEMWTRPMAIGSPPLFIAGLIGLLSFLTASVILAMTRLRQRPERTHSFDNFNALAWSSQFPRTARPTSLAMSRGR